VRSDIDDLRWDFWILKGGKKVEIYTIKHGVMRQIPEDFELKQLVKYIFAFVIGMMLGNFWPHLQ
jgi:hypothetical protein